MNLLESKRAVKEAKKQFHQARKRLYQAARELMLAKREAQVHPPVDAVHKYRAQGLSFGAIAKMMGTDRSQIQRWEKRK